ncbi:MAG: signal peptidase II [Acidobacteriota bacterium]
MTSEAQAPPASATPPDRGSDHAQRLADMKVKWRYLILAAVVLILDQWTKWLIESHLARHDSMEVIPQLLNFTHVRNTGVAFGFFASYGNATGTLVLILLGLAALCFVAYYFWLVPRGDKPLLVALALVIGGAIGNLVDRIMQGGVTDFIDFYRGTYHWHTFNIADTAISIGIGLMILGTFRRPNEGSEVSESRPTPSTP